MGIKWPSLDLKPGGFRFGEPEPKVPKKRHEQLQAEEKRFSEEPKWPAFKKEEAEKKPSSLKKKSSEEKRPEKQDRDEAESPTALVHRALPQERKLVRSPSQKQEPPPQDNLALEDGRVRESLTLEAGKGAAAQTSSKKQRLALARQEGAQLALKQEDKDTANWQSAAAHGINCKAKESCETRKRALAALFRDVRAHGSAALKKRLREFSVLEDCNVDQSLNKRWRQKCRRALMHAFHPDSLGKAGAKLEPHKAEMDRAWGDLFDCGLNCRATDALSARGETPQRLEDQQRSVQLKALPQYS